MSKSDPFKYLKTSREITRLAVMIYVRFPLPLRNVEDLVHERGIDVGHEAVRLWWHRFGPMVASKARQKRAGRLRSWPQWRWHLGEIFGKSQFLLINPDHSGTQVSSGGATQPVIKANSDRLFRCSYESNLGKFGATTRPGPSLSASSFNMDMSILAAVPPADRILR